MEFEAVPVAVYDIWWRNRARHRHGVELTVGRERDIVGVGQATVKGNEKKRVCGRVDASGVQECLVALAVVARVCSEVGRGKPRRGAHANGERHGGVRVAVEHDVSGVVGRHCDGDRTRGTGDAAGVPRDPIGRDAARRAGAEQVTAVDAVCVEDVRRAGDERPGQARGVGKVGRIRVVALRHVDVDGLGEPPARGARRHGGGLWGACVVSPAEVGIRLDFVEPGVVGGDLSLVVVAVWPDPKLARLAAVKWRSASADKNLVAPTDVPVATERAALLIGHVKFEVDRVDGIPRGVDHRRVHLAAVITPPGSRHRVVAAA